ncbi:MAG: hypothetical protein ACOC1H_04455, partial [Desulfosalsimonas sp.]
MDAKRPLYLSIEQCVDYIIEKFGPDIRIGSPLGLGKPVPVLNALYQRVKHNPDLSLVIFTALSLEKPAWTSELERRFLEPFVNRVYEGVPDLDYMTDLRKNGLPANIRLHELFCKAGAYTGNPDMQQNYMSTNYTHVVRDCEINGNQIFANMIGKSESGGKLTYSLSCNADNTIEALTEFRAARHRGENRLTIGMVNSEMPFMYGDAEVSPDVYDIIIDTGEGDHKLFNTPRLPVTDPDYMIGLNVSTLIRDGGTLQIGIGALGDAVASALDLRQNNNEVYQKVIRDAGIAETHAPIISGIGGTGTFDKGIYGSTEMLVDAFLQLYKSGVIKRKVYHHIGIQQLINQGRLTEKITPDTLRLMVGQETIHPYLTR